MKDELRSLLKQLSPSDFIKIRGLYKSLNGINGDTIDEFVENVPDRTVKGVINLCNNTLLS